MKVLTWLAKFPLTPGVMDVYSTGAACGASITNQSWGSYCRDMGTGQGTPFSNKGFHWETLYKQLLTAMGGGYALSCSPYVVVLRRKNDFLQWNHKEIKHKRGGSIMKVAIPSEGTEICAHFGHCESFTIAEVEDGKVINKQNSGCTPA